MTSRKQKHEAALAKRERFMAEQRQIGLAAQLRAQAVEKEKRAAIIAEAQAVRRRMNTILAVAALKQTLTGGE